MAIEIVDLPSYKMVIFHSYVNVYQRVPMILGNLHDLGVAQHGPGLALRRQQRRSQRSLRSVHPQVLNAWRGADGMWKLEAVLDWLVRKQ